jgi:hypothetical protein
MIWEDALSSEEATSTAVLFLALISHSQLCAVPVAVQGGGSSWLFKEMEDAFETVRAPYSNGVSVAGGDASFLPS